MAKGFITIPARLVPKLELLGKLTAEIFGEIREEEGLVPEGVPDDQRWFWSKGWQEMEREADEDIKAGRVKRFDNVEDLIADLHS
jgi:hypothetical protein